MGWQGYGGHAPTTSFSRFKPFAIAWSRASASMESSRGAFFFSDACEGKRQEGLICKLSACRSSSRPMRPRKLLSAGREQEERTHLQLQDGLVRRSPCDQPRQICQLAPRNLEVGRRRLVLCSNQVTQGQPNSIQPNSIAPARPGRERRGSTHVGCRFARLRLQSKPPLCLPDVLLLRRDIEQALGRRLLLCARLGSLCCLDALHRLFRRLNLLLALRKQIPEHVEAERDVSDLLRLSGRGDERVSERGRSAGDRARGRVQCSQCCARGLHRVRLHQRAVQGVDEVDPPLSLAR